MILGHNYIDGNSPLSSYPLSLINTEAQRVESQSNSTWRHRRYEAYFFPTCAATHLSHNSFSFSKKKKHTFSVFYSNMKVWCNKISYPARVCNTLLIILIAQFSSLSKGINHLTGDFLSTRGFPFRMVLISFERENRKWNCQLILRLR